MAANANVRFYRGAQASLKNLTAQDGAFYWTEDTNRLYICKDGNLQLLNRTVQIVSQISDLTTISNSWSASEKEAHINDFYYVTGSGTSTNNEYSNILVVWNGTTWQQINPDHDTKVSSVTIASTTAVENVATIAVTTTDSNDTEKTGTMTVTAAGGLTASSTSGNLVLTANTYELKSSVTGNNAILTLDNDNGNDDSSVQLIHGNNISFASNANGIEISATDSYLTELSGSVGEGSITIAAADNNDHNITPVTISNIGIMLQDGSYAPINATTASGATQGAIYSKNQVDNLLNGLDGMTYKGTVGTSGATVSQLPTSGVANGDTYVVITAGETVGASSIIGNVTIDGVDSNNNPIASGGSGTRVGDMFIAKGTETNGVISSGLTWTYVPSGNDSMADVTYSNINDAASNLVGIENQNNLEIFSHALSAGTGMVVSSTATSATATRLTTTIAHASHSTTATTTAVTVTSSSTASAVTITAVTGLTLNNGHVEEITNSTFSIPAYDLTGASVSMSGNKATFTIGLTDGNDNSRASAAFALDSSSLVISQPTGTTNEAKIELMWGTF